MVIAMAILRIETILKIGMSEDIFIYECGHVYSLKTIVDTTLGCPYCLEIKEGKTNNSCMEYKISKGWVYNDKTKLIRLRRITDFIDDS